MTTHAHPPLGVGRLVGEEPPECLLHIGLIVRFPDGTDGVVQHYQYYFAKQVTFPVLNSRGVTHICTARDVTVVEHPPAFKSVPVPRQRRFRREPLIEGAPALLG